MNTTYGDKDMEGLSRQMDAADLSARRPWVKPALERLSLKEALGGGGGASDHAGGSS